MRNLSEFEIQKLVEEGKMPADFTYDIRGVRGCRTVYKKEDRKFNAILSCVAWAIRKGATYVIVDITGVKKDGKEES